jgi:hypothetical protein
MIQVPLGSIPISRGHRHRCLLTVVQEGSKMGFSRLVDLIVANPKMLIV